jgi:hypothetical protein
MEKARDADGPSRAKVAASSEAFGGFVDRVLENKVELDDYKREHGLIGSEELAAQVGCSRSTPRDGRYGPQLVARGLAFRYPGPWHRPSPPWLYRRDAAHVLRELLEETARAHSASKSAWMKDRHARGKVKHKTRSGIVQPCDCGDPECPEVYRTRPGAHVYATKACANRAAAKAYLSLREEHRRKERVVTCDQAAEFLLVNRAKVYSYVDRGLIPVAEVFAVPGSGQPVVHLLETDVKRFARDRVQSSDPRVKRRFDPFAVFDDALAAHLPMERARELRELASERERRFKAIRVGTGRRPSPAPPAHYFDWLREWETLAPEARTRRCEYGECGRPAVTRLHAERSLLGCFCGAHAPLFRAEAAPLGPSEYQAALQIARAHRDRFGYDPDDAPDAAIALVLSGVKSARKALQKGISQTRAA